MPSRSTISPLAASPSASLCERATLASVSFAAATEIAPGPSTTVAKTASTTTLRVRILAEDDSHPDLGIYLQPDPAHEISLYEASSPQAYAYASGRPLKYSDPDGLYGFDESWDQDQNAKKAAGKAWAEMTKDDVCNCVFEGTPRIMRRPWADPFVIRYRPNLPVYGYSPFAAGVTAGLENVEYLSAPATSLQSIAYIEIGKTTILRDRSSKGFLRDTLAHEIAHTSSADGKEYQFPDRRSRYAIGSWCSGERSLAFPLPKDVKKCCECK